MLVPQSIFHVDQSLHEGQEKQWSKLIVDEGEMWHEKKIVGHFDRSVATNITQDEKNT